MKSIILCACVCLASCVSATVNESAACYDKQVSFDLSSALTAAESQLPSGAVGFNLTTLCMSGNAGGAAGAAASAAGSVDYQLPPLSTSTSYDFSKDLSKITDVASNVSVSITSLMLSNTNGDLDFVSHAEVDMSGNNLPSVMLATFDANGGSVGTSLTAQIKASSATILSYLKAGPVQLTFTMDSSPVPLTQVCKLAGMTSLSTDADMCVSVSGSFSKSL